MAIAVSDVVGGERLVFTENASAPVADQDGGAQGGSFDLTNGSNAYLTFEPSYFGGHNLYQEGGFAGSFGNYLALAAGIPEPTSWAMMLIGFGVLGVAARARRRTITAGA